MNKFDTTTAHPISTDHDGLGAFVTLDYTTLDFKTRYEHAIVMLPEHWGSLYSLIRAPGAFVEAYRRRYKDTPSHNHNALPSKEWQFSGPITILIEPLTVPSPSNAAILKSLAPLYPPFSTIAAQWSELSPRDFLGKILLAIDSTVAAAVPWKMKESKVKQQPFALQYVAEFALKTRTLRIKYVPRPVPAGQPEPLFDYPITLTTVNPVTNTGLTFLHFDADFGSDHTVDAVADARAKFAMDFIVDPAFINLLVPNPGAVTANAPFLPTSFLNELPANQPTTVTMPKFQGIGVKPTGSSQVYYQPRLAIDSVWANPLDVSPSDPVPPLCFLITGHPVIQVGNDWYYETAEGLEKAYSAGGS